MSDETPDQFEQITAGAGTSALHEAVVEHHEIYAELLTVGFPERAANQIIALMLYDAIAYGGLDEAETTVEIEHDEDDDEDDEQLDGSI
jgi:hypothetical protein